MKRKKIDSFTLFVILLLTLILTLLGMLLAGMKEEKRQFTVLLPLGDLAYEAWMNEQKKEMESLIGTGDGWYDGQGVFHEFTQESVDAMMDSYKETLESIKKGVLYSKDDGDGDTYSMIPPTEDVVSSYSVDVTKDNGKTVHIGDYSTVEELDKAISDAVKNGQLTQEEADSVQK